MATGKFIGGALMWPFPNPLDLFGDAIGGVVGWAWDKVIQGIYTWFANGLLLLMEWVWGVLDTATTPRLNEAWFETGLVRPLAGISLGITIALMLASAVQAGFGGRPEGGGGPGCRTAQALVRCCAALSARNHRTWCRLRTARRHAR